MVPAHRDAEVKAVKLDNRSSPVVVLIGTVGGAAAEVKMQDSSRMASQSPLRCCMAMGSTVVCSEE